MKRIAKHAILGAGLLAALGLLIGYLTGPSATPDLTAATALDRAPRLRPDYSGATIPPNIAPLNFRVEEPGTAYHVRIRADEGEAIDLASPSGSIEIPVLRWRQLLAANRGGRLSFEVCVRGDDGQWARFQAVRSSIADADIDRYLCYRLLGPVYHVGVNMSIRQRDVQTYEETMVVNGRSIGGEGACVNCHTFVPNHPDQMSLHSRGPAESPERNAMVVVRRGQVLRVDSRKLIRDQESKRGRVPKSLASYIAWHPNGRLAAFVAAEVSLFLHAVGENRDVFPAESDLALYHADSNTVTTVPQISQAGRVETFPAWSPDGLHLYFCSTDPRTMESHREIRYDLMRIGYDPEADRWGDLEPVLLAKDTGKSIVEPRISPDGRWLLFCMCDYGEFPVYQASSDLYLMELKTRRYRRLEINSPRSESWHSWSSNSRWIVFTSKREDGVFARLYLSYVDPQGRAHKPVLLPQKDPTFYDRFLKTYNAPELTPTPAPATGHAIADVICRGSRFTDKTAAAADRDD